MIKDTERDRRQRMLTIVAVVVSLIVIGDVISRALYLESRTGSTSLLDSIILESEQLRGKVISSVRLDSDISKDLIALNKRLDAVKSTIVDDGTYAKKISELLVDVESLRDRLANKMPLGSDTAALNASFNELLKKLDEFRLLSGSLSNEPAFVVAARQTISSIYSTLGAWGLGLFFVITIAYLSGALEKVFVGIADRIDDLSISVGNIKLETDPNAIAIRQSKVLGQFSALQDIVKADYLTTVNSKRVDAAFAETVAIYAQQHPELVAADFRATLHVPFYLNPESLVQIVDYFDENGQKHEMPGVRRVHSIRFGIIGRAWRREKSDYDPHVETDPEKLVRNWGMLESEANRPRDRQSMAAILLRSAQTNTALAVMFLDAVGTSIFGVPEATPEETALEIETELQAMSKNTGLIDALANLKDTIRWQERIKEGQG